MIAVKAIATVAKPLVEPFVKEFVKSKLQDFAKWCEKEGKKVANPKSEHFKSYLERMYDKCNVVKTMVFPTSQLRLKDIYIPLTLVKNNWMLRKRDLIVIDGVPKELIKYYKKIIITDTAGMGKSTVLKRIFIALIDDLQESIGIPIYIELNKLHEGHLIVDEIREELKTLFETDYNELFLGFIQTGGFIFFLDGYDEISSDKAFVTNDIQDFISKAGPNNYYFLTSRPDAWLNSFGDFQSFSIRPLERQEAFELLKKYDLSENKVVSESLIETLNSGKYSSIEEYLGNPLLVSLLFTAYNYRQIVPLKKCQFYRQVYDALFEAHKLALGVEPHKKHSLSDIDDFNRVLRYVGYECLIKNGVHFDEDTILRSIGRAKKFYGNLDFGSSAFLKDLWTTVPLFVKEGTEYSWAHKSLMEYFAAHFIFADAKDEQDNILSAIFKSRDVSKYGNMLDIYYDIDYKGFAKNIILPICESYIKFYEGSRVESPMIDQESIDLRKSLLFLGDYGIEFGEADPFEFDGVSFMFSTHVCYSSLLRGIRHWISFCYQLFEAKGRPSLNYNKKILLKKEDNLYGEMIKILRHRKDDVCGIIEASREEKDINKWDDNCIMVKDTKDDKCVCIKIFDNQIVIKRITGTNHGGMAIDSHTGESHPLLFTAFTISMLHCLQSDNQFGMESLMLNYNACKRELESIRGMLPSSKNKSILLDGI